ncbi:MAG: hypothetical protein KJZ84_12750 [Bryobacteraceae bacterium]|nr:hypothetical protein [Bryobacteraceae bacterium]
MWRAATLLAVLSGGLAGQTARVDGEWNWKMASPMGEMTARVELRTEGSKLMGTFHFSESRRLEIEDGTITGNELRFVLRRTRSEGGTMVYEMMGRVSGNLIQGTARTPVGDPPAAAEWVMQRVMPAPKTTGPVSESRPHH